VREHANTIQGSNTSAYQINIQVLPPNTNLTTNTNNLVLSVSGYTEFGLLGNPASGAARSFSVTNNGSYPAIDLTFDSSLLPTGTTVSSNCGTTINAGATCTVLVTPGATPSNDASNNPCSIGTAPIAQPLIINSFNGTLISVNVTVLTYGCIYQQGYVFAFDDTNTSSFYVGGKVIALTDQANGNSGTGVFWSSLDGLSVDYTSILGISEQSTTRSADPNSPAYPTTPPSYTSCDGATDGACNTQNIYEYYNFYTAPDTVYAAGVCYNINSLHDWYLPSICDMGYNNPNNPSGIIICGDNINPTLQNIQSSLIDQGNSAGLTSGIVYWSSTEPSTNPTNGSWSRIFYQQTGGGAAGVQTGQDKANKRSVRCVRNITT
jgi:hypothetical protein